MKGIILWLSKNKLFLLQKIIIFITVVPKQLIGLFFCQVRDGKTDTSASIFIEMVKEETLLLLAKLQC